MLLVILALPVVAILCIAAVVGFPGAIVAALLVYVASVVLGFIAEAL